jgi:signal transduction histidine kinase/CheY-like chemotaxis protein
MEDAMPQNPSTWQGSRLASRFFAASLLMVAIQTVLLVCFSRAAIHVSGLIVGIYPALSAVVCFTGARRDSPGFRQLRFLLGAGFSLAAIGQLQSTYWEFSSQSIVQTEALNSDFFFFAYGIPILLAICSRERDAGLKIFARLDGAQAVLAAVLAYLLLFRALPFLPRSQSLSALDLMYLNNAENWILVVAVTMRLFSNPGPAKKRFYRALSYYLWIYAIVAAILGYLELKRGWADGLQDVAWGIPYLPFFGSLAFARRTSETSSAPSTSERGIGLLIENFSPVFFTLAIALMTVEAAPDHPILARICVSAAILIYGSRAAVLQVNYVRSQQNLTTAMIATEQASIAKSQFLANISHEIRTPMNGIIGMTELALNTRLNDEQRDFLSIVKSSADHLLIIINEILDFSKMEAGKTVLESESFLLLKVMNSALRSVAVLAHRKGLELTLRIAPDVPGSLLGDRGRLTQVLINLLGNAIKFTERGEVCVEVTRSASTEENATLLFSVRDTGIGIPVDKQAAVFEVFQQAHSSGNRVHGGTGLGLAVCRSLIGLMGGAIWLQSTPDAGTTIFFDARFSLPAGWRPALDIPGHNSSDSEPSGWPVLVVDDNTTSRNLLIEVLDYWSLEPHACGVNEIAETLAHAEVAGKPYRLILLDDALAAAVDVAVFNRGYGASPDSIPIVRMMDCHDRGGEANRAAEPAHRVIKPIVADELWTSMQTALGLVGSRLESESVPTPAVARHSLRVLLADDNLVNRKVASGMLANMGHTITQTTNGLEALEMWRGREFDLILMDVHMPEMDGLQATTSIRQAEPPGTHTPIVAMTASAMNEDRERCLAAGMDDFLSKPVSQKDLAQAIERICR